MRGLRFLPLLLLLSLLALTACSRATPTTPPSPPQETVTQTIAAPTATQGAISPTEPSPASPTVTYTIVAAESKACYRVREQLAGFSLPNDAVGCTSDIEGQVVLDTQRLTFQEGSFVRVNLSTLTSDRSRRDQYLRRNTLQTDRYPYATFVPKVLEGVTPPLPTSGSVTIRVIGDLTIREVTREVVWEGTAEVAGNRVTMQLQTAFTFDDFQLVRPQVPIVLSIEDPIRLEIRLVWEQRE